MATKTDNYALVKPDYSDGVDIAQLNNNFSIIDKLADQTIGGVERGTTATYAHPKGSYFYWVGPNVNWYKGELHYNDMQVAEANKDIAVGDSLSIGTSVSASLATPSSMISAINSLNDSSVKLLPPNQVGSVLYNLTEYMYQSTCMYIGFFDWRDSRAAEKRTTIYMIADWLCLGFTNNGNYALSVNSDAQTASWIPLQETDPEASSMLNWNGNAGMNFYKPDGGHSKSRLLTLNHTMIGVDGAGFKTPFTNFSDDWSPVQPTYSAAFLNINGNFYPGLAGLVNDSSGHGAFQIYIPPNAANDLKAGGNKVAVYATIPYIAKA